MPKTIQEIIEKIDQEIEVNRAVPHPTPDQLERLKTSTATLELLKRWIEN